MTRFGSGNGRRVESRNDGVAISGSISQCRRQGLIKSIKLTSSNSTLLAALSIVFPTALGGAAVSWCWEPKEHGLLKELLLENARLTAWEEKDG